MAEGFPGGSDGKESACSAGELGSVLGSEGPLEEGMATHSRILAWRIPWTEGHGGLLSIESQRIRHDQVINNNRSSVNVQGHTARKCNLLPTSPGRKRGSGKPMLYNPKLIRTTWIQIGRRCGTE